MSDLPFGFTPEPGDDEGADRDPVPGGPGDPANPFAALFGGSPARPRRGVRSGSASCCRTRAARSTGTWPGTSRGRPRVRGRRPDAERRERKEVEEAVRLADLWLDAATALPAGGGTGAGLEPRRVGRADAAGVAGAGRPGRGQVGRRDGAWRCPRRCRPMAGPLLGMMRQLGGAMFGAQVGPGARRAGRRGGRLRRRRPAARPGRPAALLPANVDGVRRGPRRPADEVRLYLALREAAYQRLFAHVPWLRAAALRRGRGVRARASPSTPAGSRKPSASSTPATPRRCRRRCRRACSSRRTPPRRRRRWPGWRRCSRSSRAGSTRSCTRRREPRCRRRGALRETVRRRRADRRPGRADLRHAGRPGAAAAPAAGGGAAVGAAGGRARHRGPRRRLGAPRPAADRRRPRRPGRLRHRERRSTCRRAGRHRRAAEPDSRRRGPERRRSRADDAGATADHVDAARRRRAGRCPRGRRRRASRSRCAAAYLDYLAAHPDAMCAACVPAHLTASALVLDPARRGCC